MNTYETNARVEDQGRVEVIGVPFAAGTEVQIAIAFPMRIGRRVRVLLFAGGFAAAVGLLGPADGLAQGAKRATDRPNEPTEGGAAETVTNSISMKLALIPAGEFDMGSPDSDVLPAPATERQHRVRITKPFYMGVYEVTQGEYERVTGTNPSWFSPGGGGEAQVKRLDTRRFPVERVSWNDAQDFCRKLSNMRAEKSAGNVYELPTEAQWEYACRAGTITAFHFDDTLNGRQPNSAGNFGSGSDKVPSQLKRTTAVGSYKNANAFGLYDMHGNVFEWCSDWYERDLGRSPTNDPQGPSAGIFRAIRGGGWNFDPGFCGSASRYLSSEPAERRSFTGFRVIRAR